MFILVSPFFDRYLTILMRDPTFQDIHQQSSDDRRDAMWRAIDR